jgi:hypothetical protein
MAAVRQMPTCCVDTANHILPDGHPFKNRGDLAIVVEGDKKLFNQYGVMLVDPAKYPTVKKDLGQAFIDWLISLRPAVVLPERQRSECVMWQVWCFRFARSGERAVDDGCEKRTWISRDRVNMIYE